MPGRGFRGQDLFPAYSKQTIRHIGHHGVGLYLRQNRGEKNKKRNGTTRKHIFPHRLQMDAAIHPQRARPAQGCILSRLPYTRTFAFTNIPLKPNFDDMAQIVGTSAGCIEDMTETCQKEPGSRNAIFVKGDGALCLGRDPSDATAVQMVLEKASRSHIALRHQAGKGGMGQKAHSQVRRMR